MDNFNKQQSNLVNLLEPSIRVLVNFYEKEQVDEFQGKGSMMLLLIKRKL